ncbi:hypothetical protein AK812_SmicGene3181 [Symbiodinium microadriaticum]|uniref:Uncharacterized protein n=1 Tax=Symbiodinium microadriaticum TaxID=2951 RepID=A0A1Q9EZL7_SYMMI|nr:hypothetical protein AK812_SmicGene3181 [Symbiodinium microadriaticum]
MGARELYGAEADDRRASRGGDGLTVVRAHRGRPGAAHRRQGQAPVGEYQDGQRHGSGNVEVGFYDKGKDKGRAVRLTARTARSLRAVRSESGEGARAATPSVTGLTEGVAAHSVATFRRERSLRRFVEKLAAMACTDTVKTSQETLKSIVSRLRGDPDEDRQQAKELAEVLKAKEKLELQLKAMKVERDLLEEQLKKAQKEAHAAKEDAIQAREETKVANNAVIHVQRLATTTSRSVGRPKQIKQKQRCLRSRKKRKRRQRQQRKQLRRPFKS